MFISFQVPYLDDYKNWLSELPAPLHFPATGRFPLYITLQEHFICGLSPILPWNDTDKGTLNAYLPSDLKWDETSVRASDLVKFPGY